MDFKSVGDAWIQMDAIIYTATLTAGVSFEKEHFDIAVNVLTKDTCSAVGFVQGIHRVRNLKYKTQIIYTEALYPSQGISPKDFTNLYVNMDSLLNVEASIDLSVQR